MNTNGIKRKELQIVVANSRPTIYLAGPISGLTYGESTTWRENFAEDVYPAIQCFSPMRYKSYLDVGGVIKDQYDQATTGPLSTQKGIMTRDFFDCTRADLIVANLLDSKKVSIGTCMEMAWAFSKFTPVIAIMEDEGNPHDHAMIRETIGFRVNNVAEAISVARAILVTEV